MDCSFWGNFLILRFLREFRVTALLVNIRCLGVHWLVVLLYFATLRGLIV